jgi:hypothetical protein
MQPHCQAVERHAVTEIHQANDRLTRRERAVYKLLHALGLAWGGLGLVWFFVLERTAPTYTEAVAFAIGCLLVPIFGLALRNDTRVIHGILWLRKE